MKYKYNYVFALINFEGNSSYEGRDYFKEMLIEEEPIWVVGYLRDNNLQVNTQNVVQYFLNNLDEADITISISDCEFLEEIVEKWINDWGK